MPIMDKTLKETLSACHELTATLSGVRPAAGKHPIHISGLMVGRPTMLLEIFKSALKHHVVLLGVSAVAPPILRTPNRKECVMVTRRREPGVKEAKSMSETSGEAS
jgi:hypothetical protein